MLDCFYLTLERGVVAATKISFNELILILKVETENKNDPFLSPSWQGCCRTFF